MKGSLSPFPSGWFFVCYADELGAGDLLQKTWLGRDIVAFRAPDGRARALDARAGDGAPREWPVHEVEGLVMAYFDAQGRAPTWHIPAFGLDGFSELARHHFRIKGHPQDTTENCVDSAHLVTIHGYEDVQPVRAPEADGPHLSGAYRMRRGSRMPFVRGLKVGMEVMFEVDVWGLGHSTVQIGLPRFGTKVRLLTLATPSDGEYIDLHIALRVNLPVQQLPAPLRELVTAPVLALAKRAYMHDIQQDFDIWQNKIYLPRPNLARNDGPILQFRRYCKQFYPELESEAARAA